jgi:glycosyltransferase involved in cell wall biosynthesis
MNDVPVISVVTPSFNQGEYLEETLLSVLSQQGDFFLDYLIVDGASTDRSLQIIREFEQRIEQGEWSGGCRGIRYRWLSEVDRGQTDALQKGFRMADGGILAWLNSDDVYLPGTLQAVAGFFRSDAETVLFYGDAHYCDATGAVVGRYPTEAFDGEKLAWFNFFCQPATFFREEAFATVGGLDPSLHFAMDYDLFIRLAQSGKTRYLPRYFAKYRLHAEAKTVADDMLCRNHEEALRVVMKHFDWAPLNRVYGWCYYACLAKMPGLLPKFRILSILAALVCALPRSVWLNRGLRRQDLKLLSRSNFHKLFKDRLEILRG